MADQPPATPVNTDPLNQPEPAEPFFDELDNQKRSASRSCCTVWTLGLGLLTSLALGLWLIFTL